MKNLLKFAFIAVLGLFLFAACESKPEPKPEPPAPVVVEEPTPEPAPEPIPEPAPIATVSYSEYTVKVGDTLSQIAEKFYGSKDRAYFFPIIVAYTLDSFSTVTVDDQSVKLSFADPDVIEPGTVLRVPNFEQFMSSKLHTELARPLFEKFAKQYERKARSGVSRLLRERAERLGSK